MSLSDILGILGIVVALILFCVGANHSVENRIIISLAILVVATFILLIPRLASGTESPSSTTSAPSTSTNPPSKAPVIMATGTPSPAFTYPTPSTPTPEPVEDSTRWIPSANSKPSKADLDSVNTNKNYPNNIVYPKSSSYLSQYETMYVKSTKGYGIYLFWSPECSMDTKRNHDVEEGKVVTVIAREKNASCIIYMSDAGYPITGWVESGFLVSRYY